MKIERLFFAAALGYALATLCGCANASRDYHAMVDCRSQAGPEPDAVADLFGAAGCMASGQDPEREAWNKRVDQCFRARTAAR